MSHVLRCACGGLNRVAPGRPDPTCGRCHAPLDPTNPPAEVDDAALERLIRASPVPVLVDFWAPWCGPCRTVAPHLKALAQRPAGKLIVAKVNVDQHKEHAARLNVQAIPTLALFQGGRPVRVEAGARMGPALDELVAGVV
jgi:thioredoxin 2